MSAHAKLSPSGAKTWLNCAGSVEAQASEPDITSVYAAEGTAAHAVRSACLKFGLDPYDFIGQIRKVQGFVLERGKLKETTFEFPVTEEWADYLQTGIYRVLDLGGRLFVEKRVSLSRWLGPNQFGTLDTGILLPREIHIDDLKFGVGVPVSPVENEQCMLYALGFIDLLEKEGHDLSGVRRIVMTIDQPRCPGGGGQWECSWDHLMKFGEFASERAKEALTPGAPRTAGIDQCKWCKAAKPGKCAEYDEFNIKLFASKFEDLDTDEAPTLKKLSELTPERRSYIIAHWSMISSWYEQMHADAISDALAGRACPGFKTVEGRKPHRAWADSATAEKYLLGKLTDKEVYVTEIISPAVAEKKVLKGLRKDARKEAEAEFKEQWKQGDGKPVLVPLTDERPALKTHIEKFEDLSSENSGRRKEDQSLRMRRSM